MNQIFNDIGKRMPYRESDEYLNGLIEKSTEKAILHHSAARRNWRRRLMAASAAAVTLLILGIGVALFNGSDAHPAPMSGQGPLDEFLSTLSDEEAAQLTFYEMEEIPEY